MAISYHVELKITGGSTTLITGIAASGYVATGLIAETGYEWRIRQIDTGVNGAVVPSAWTAWDTFTTAAANVDIFLSFSPLAETNTVTELSTADTVIPVITLLGDAVERHILNTAYVDAGATATDNVDGSITGSIVPTSTVDANSIGFYTVTYNVNDAAGNSAIPVVRSVLVNTAEAALSYNLNYREAGQSTNSVTGLGSSPYELTGLTQGTDYEFQVQAVGTLENSPFSAWTAFSTDAVTAPLFISISPVVETSSTSEIVSSLEPEISIALPSVSGSSVASVIGLALTADKNLSLAPIIQVSSVGSLTLITDKQISLGAIAEAGTASIMRLGTDKDLSFDGIGSVESVSVLSTNVTGGIAVLPATQWNIEYRDVLTQTITAISFINSQSYDLTGLSGATNYEFRVQGLASYGTVTGEWSEWYFFVTTAAPVVLTPIFSTSHSLDTFSVIIESVVYDSGILTLSGTATDGAQVLFSVADESFYQLVTAPAWSFSKTVPNTDLLSIDTLDELDEYAGASNYLLDAGEQVSGIDGIIF